jgi:hypothetical protein
MKRLSRDLRDVAPRLERLNTSVDALPERLLGHHRFLDLPKEVSRCHLWVEAIRRRRQKNPKQFQRAAVAQLIVYVERTTGTLHARELGDLLNLSPEAVAVWRSRNARLIDQTRTASLRGTPPLPKSDLPPKNG